MFRSKQSMSETQRSGAAVRGRRSAAGIGTKAPEGNIRGITEYNPSKAHCIGIGSRENISRTREGMSLRVGGGRSFSSRTHVGRVPIIVKLRFWTQHEFNWPVELLHLLTNTTKDEMFCDSCNSALWTIPGVIMYVVFSVTLVLPLKSIFLL